MIFVTVGTTKFPFDRLLQAVDEAMISLNTKEKLVVQQGESNYCFSYTHAEQSAELSFEKMFNLITEARIIITHGGPATIYLALQKSKNLPLVVPRLVKYNEHVDDHQLYFAKYMQGRVCAATAGLDLGKIISQYLASPYRNHKNKANRPVRTGLVYKLTEYTASQL